MAAASESIHPVAVEHLPMFITPPGETDVLIVTMAGILLTDLIAGRENPWAKLYDPARVNPKALHTYAKDNLTVAALIVIQIDI